MDDDEAESRFSDILKYMKKEDKNKGKVKKKKSKKIASGQAPTRISQSQPPKSRSIDEINRMLASMAENKTNLISSHPQQIDQKLLESSLFVNYNPGGRLNRRHGSMESMGSGTYSVGSTGSTTGSTGSAGSIINPIRSSMKKPKSRSASGSTISGSSATSGKKSVRYAMGGEQTTV